MFLVADRAEVFLGQYLINTRQTISGEFYCVCRRSDGSQLELEETHLTQDAALRRCQIVAILDSMAASNAPQMLAVATDEGDKIIHANGPAEALMGGCLKGRPYYCSTKREDLLSAGVNKCLVKCIDLNGRQSCVQVSEQLIKLAGAVLILATINPLNS